MTMEMVAAPQGHTMLAARGPLTFTAEQRQMIRDSFANGASDAEFAVLMAVAEARSLNPLLRQVHFVSRWDSMKERNVWSTQVSIDGLRAIAERTGNYAGQDEPEFIENEDGSLKCCKVRVYRKDWGDRPAVGVAYWSEYVQTRWDKKASKHVVTSFWQRMPHTMLAKCAESLALRKAFPEDTSGLYTPEEMGQADNDRPEVEEQPAPRRARVQQPAPRELPAQLPDDAQRAADAQRATNDDARAEAAAPAEAPAQLAEFLDRVDEIELPGEAVSVWMKHRHDLQALSAADREAAWKHLCARTEEVGKMKNAKVWLKKAIAEEDARRATGADPQAVLQDAGSPRAETPRSAAPTAAETAPTDGPVTLDDVCGQVPRCNTERALADLWRGARDDMKRWPKGDAEKLWKAIGDRAFEVASTPAHVKALVVELDTPPRGPGGGAKPASVAREVAAMADYQGVDPSDAAQLSASAPVALVPAWGSDRATAEAFIAGMGHELVVENACRKYRTGIPDYARGFLAARLQRLSYDAATDSEMVAAQCRKLVDRWIAEGKIAVTVKSLRGKNMQRTAGGAQ